MPWLRASETDRVLTCPGSLLLPRVEDTTTGEGAAWGDGMHRAWQYDRALPEKGYERHGPQIEERLPIVRRWRPEFWPTWAPEGTPGTTGRVERCIAIHVGDGEWRDWPNKLWDGHISPNAGVAWADGLDADERDAWREKFDDNWITGSIDYCDDDHVFGDPLISDLKTGRREDKAVRERYQQWVYALGMRLITGAARVVGNVVLHPRYPKADAPTAIWATWTADELDAFHRRLKNERARIRAIEKDDVIAALTAGDHCTFCPSRRACPVGHSGSAELTH